MLSDETSTAQDSADLAPATPLETPAQAVETAVTTTTDAVVDGWFASHFHNLGPRLDVEIYNILHAAKEDLKRILGALNPSASEEQ